MAANLDDMTDKLFAQIERLNDPALTPDGIEREIKRSRAVVAEAKPVLRAATQKLRFAKRLARSRLPTLLVRGGR